jgi:glycerol-3-phosphate dehydrogenase subunit B
VRVVVIGSGVAGTAAAWVAAREGGAQVTLVSRESGASALATGALDFEPGGSREVGALDARVSEVLGALAAYEVPTAQGVLVATTAGLIRRARGRDAALLDLGDLGAKPVGVVCARRPGWDADALARSWTGQHGVETVPIDATILRYTDEHVLPDADFAARHDEDARLAWLADRLREALSRHGARLGGLLLPPALGVELARAQALSAHVGLRCGEASGLPGGPAGLRFLHARDRALSACGVVRMAGRAVSVERGDDTWMVTLAEGQPLEADAVVLATGGLIGGGVEYTPSEWLPGAELPLAARVPFQFSVRVDTLRVGARGHPLELPGSLFGLPPESLAWPFAADALMDRVGALADAEGRAGEGLFVAGELAADVPHAWLSAMASGARAGAAAALARLLIGRPASPDAAPPSPL